MFRAFTLAAAAALTLGAGAAHAGGRTVVVADPVIVAPPPPAAYSWAGAYAGLGLGYGQSSFSFTGIPAGTFPSASGPMASLLLGYNWQGTGPMVIGGEIMLSTGRVRGSAPCPGGPAFTCSSELENLAAARLRLGYAQDRTLLFVTLGAAAGSERFEATNGVMTASSSTRLSGWTAGIGIEHAMRDGWHIRGDLEHYRFRRANHQFGPTPFTSQNRTNVVRVSLVRRF
jgi:outer membrane immunogenic protein